MTCFIILFFVDNSALRDKSRIACSASVVHQADKLLRKIVGAKIKEFTSNSTAEGNDVPPPKSKADVQVKSKQLNEVRQEVLEDLKTGFAWLPKEVVRDVEKREKGATEKLEKIILELYDLKI